MDFLICYLWAYGPESEDDAQAFFDGVVDALEGGNPFPISSRYEIALVSSPSSGNNFVAVLVLRGGKRDDTVETLESLKAWLTDKGLHYRGWESMPVSGRTIRGSLPEYEILDRYSSPRAPRKKTTQRPKRVASVEPSEEAPVAQKKWWQKIW